MEIEKEIGQVKDFENVWIKVHVNFLYTCGHLNDKIKTIFGNEGLTPQQYNILRILKGQHPKPISTSEIKRKMIDKSPDISRMVDRLVKKGWVVRQVNENDKRLVDVIITEEGILKLSEADKSRGNISNLYKNLSEEEAHLLSNLLDKLRG